MNRSAGGKPDILFVLSVDTEEEWDWSGPLPQQDFSVANATHIPAFQAFCDVRGIRPTYFVDYAVADDDAGAAALRKVLDGGRCEIGAHLHPWANPPYYGDTSEFESHMVNLPLAQTEAKLDALLDKLSDAFGVVPNAFRTGRWGINGPILELLRSRGFGVDSSMYPCFSNAYFDCEHTPLEPYWPDFNDPRQAGAQRDILELPATVGFNRADQAAMLRLYKLISNPRFEPLRLVGIFWRLHLLRKLYLSPEVITAEEMQPLLDVALSQNRPMLHMFLHSSSLIDNSGGMLNAENALQTVQGNIARFLDYAESKANVSYCTISEAATWGSHRARLAA